MHANNHSSQGAEADGLPRVGEGEEKGEKRKEIQTENSAIQLRDSHAIIAVLKQSTIYHVQCFKEYLSCILTDLQVLRP